MVIYLDVLCSGSYGYGSIPLASTFLDEHTGWWFQTCLFSIICGIILPIDFHISHELVKTTNKYKYEF